MKHVQTELGMRLDEFLEAANEQPFELINGERRLILPDVFGGSLTIRSLFMSLYSFVSQHSLGGVYSKMTYVLSDADDRDWVIGSRAPDVLFLAGDRLAAYKAETTDFAERPLALIPDLVAEIISPTDRYSDVDEKVDAYLRDGARLIWVIDPKRRKAIVYAPHLEQPLHLNDKDSLDGGDVIPDFRIELAKLFE